MTKQFFTTNQQNELRMNPHVKKVSDKAITYTDAFKESFIEAYKQGKMPQEIFQEAGFDVEALGSTRIQKASNRWRSAYNQKGIAGLTDTRKQASGRPLSRKLSLEEQVKRLEAKLKWLEVENDFLKKLEQLERQAKKPKSK